MKSGNKTDTRSNGHSSRQQVKELENAILDRARNLAQEFTHKAKRQRDNLLRESKEKLRLTEEREILQAKVDADRQARRRIQASELRLHGRLDQLRWELVQSVQSRLSEHINTLREDRSAYRDWLIAMIAEGASLLPEGELQAEVIADDHSWLEKEWPTIIDQAAPGRHIRLNQQPTWGNGGIRLRNADDTAQVDNRFEGRLSRLEPQIQRVILERLFSGGFSNLNRSS